MTRQKYCVALLCLSREDERTLKIPTEKPTPTLEYFKRKHQTLFTDIGGECDLKFLSNPKPPTNNTGLIKK